MTQSLASPFTIFTDIDGDPLESGYIYVGIAGLNAETNPISVYWDAALTVPATQPIRTLNGYPSHNGTPAVVYIDEDDASVIVKNKNGSLVFSILTQTERFSSYLATFTQVGVGAVTINVQDKVRQILSVEDFLTPQHSVNQATLDSNSVYLPAGDFSGDITNDAGVMIEGPGRLFDSNNVQRSTYAEPRSRFVIGQEYLWSFHYAVLNTPPGTQLQIVFTGDSTTFGAFNGGTLPGAYRIHNLNDAQLNRYGLYGPVSINSGVNGMQCREWVVPTTGKLDQDIAAYPNMALYVIRLGLNDGSIGYHDIDDFRTSIRTGLARLRAWKGAANLSIVLMSPNSTSETAYRDEAWNEQVSQILKKAARDYQCCFIDTYAMWRDSRGAAINNWLDDDGNGGSGIHPDGVFNHWIMNLFGEVVYAPLAVRTAATNTFINAPGTATRAITTSVTASDFVRGVSIFRTDLPLTFPIDGCVIVTKQADGIVRQENIGFANDISKKTYTRYALEGGAWSDWRGLDVSVNPSTGWSIYDASTPYPAYRKTEDGTVHVSARVKNPSATIGSEIFVLPAGYRPGAIMRFPIYNWAGTTFGTVQVGTDGGVVYVSGDVNDVTFNFAFQALQ